MKSGKNLNELITEIQSIAAVKKDYMVDSRKIELINDVDKMQIVVNDQPLDFEINHLCHRQIGSALGIPAKYYDKMYDFSRELLYQNIKTWWDSQPKNYFLRTLDTQARAFLSSRYHVIDNDLLAATVLPILTEHPELSIVSCDLTDTSLYIKAVNKSVQGEVRPGDIIYSGVIISNSEVGVGSVSVRPLAFRLVCSNGMIVNDFGVNQIHLGRDQLSDALLSEETKQEEDKLFISKLKDIARVTADGKGFDKVLATLQKSVEQHFVGTPTEAVEVAKRNYGFTKAETDRVLESLIRSNDYTLYGLGNAITEVSQTFEKYERATEFERIGWEIVSHNDYRLYQGA